MCLWMKMSVFSYRWRQHDILTENNARATLVLAQRRYKSNLGISSYCPHGTSKTKRARFVVSKRAHRSRARSAERSTDLLTRTTPRVATPDSLIILSHEVRTSVHHSRDKNGRGGFSRERTRHGTRSKIQ